MSKWRIIGISGITCGGKTSLSEKLMKTYPNSVLINQDQFYRSDDDPNHEWINISPGVNHQNWESMVSVDWLAFSQAIQLSLDKEVPNESSLLIIEGHLIFNYKDISDLCQKKFFITLEKDECFARRELRQYLPQDPKGYFEAWVWPMFLKNKEEMQKIDSNNEIDGSLDQELLCDIVIKSLSN